uniref:Uncharacterized protein n=1 Tax=Rhizophora mucronata TaxID=61149 RepID=A0A2P2QGK8_RHIMU
MQLKKGVLLHVDRHIKKRIIIVFFLIMVASHICVHLLLFWPCLVNWL